MGISGQCHPTAVCGNHMGSEGKQGLFMLGANSSSWVYGLSHLGAQSFPHLFLTMTENVNDPLNHSQLVAYVLCTFLPSL